MKWFFAVLVGCLLFSVDASARVLRGSGGPVAATGQTVINIPGMAAGLMFGNDFLSASAPGNNFSTANLSAISDKGFPNGNTLGAGYSLQTIIKPPSAGTFAGVYVIDWVGTIPATSFSMIAASTVTSCTSSAGSGCGANCVSSGGAGTGNTTFGKAGTAGQNCRVEFTFASGSIPDGSTPTNFFFNTGTAPNLTSLRIFRKDDEQNNGGIVPKWNPDFLNTVNSSGSNPHILRAMGDMLNAGNENVLVNPSFALRTPIDAISYNMRRFPTSQISVGNFTLTGNNFAASASYPGQPVNWTDKEVFQGNFQSAGSSTTVTSAANNGSGLIRLLVANTASLTTGQVISYTGYNSTGGTGYGQWTITVVDPTHIDLTASYPTGNPSAFGTFSSSPGFFTTMTIQLGTRTPVPLIGPGSFPTGAFGLNIVATGIGSVMYDAQLQVAIYSPGGLYTGMPIEVLVDLGNQINKDVWFNFPSTVLLSTAISTIQYAASNLKLGLSAYFEHTNEPWNAAFYQQFYLNKLGEAVGITTNASTDSSSNYFSFQGMKSAQIFQAAVSNWSKPQANLKSVLNVQFANNQSTVDTIEFQGSLLDPTHNQLLCQYLGGTFSGACSGATNYSATGTRPVDLMTTPAYAPYAEMPYTTSGVVTIAQTYQTNPTSALASFQTLMTGVYTSGTVYGNWETTFANYDASRLPGYGPLAVVCYEGGQSLVPPTVAQYTSLGLTSSGTVTFNLGSSPAINQTAHGYINGSKVNFSGGTPPTGLSLGIDYFVINAGLNSYDISVRYYSSAAITLSGSPSGTTTAAGSTTSIDNLFEGWKNSASADTWVFGYIDNFKSFPHSKYMAWLQEDGVFWNLALAPANNNNRWSILTGNVYSQPTEIYNAIRTCNTVGCFSLCFFAFRRRRRPRPNDNDPMWLEKAQQNKRRLCR